MQCRNCGLELPKNAKFCYECGIRTNKELLSWLKTIYVKAKANDIEWKKIFYGTTSCYSGIGIYTDIVLQTENTYSYVKYSIKYYPTYDIDDIFYDWSKKGKIYYVLYKLKLDRLEDADVIPEPSNDDRTKNDPGRWWFFNDGDAEAVFDDEETAKRVAVHKLLEEIAPFKLLLTEEESKDWDEWFSKNIS